jgi:hypothetical protein
MKGWSFIRGLQRQHKQDREPVTVAIMKRLSIHVSNSFRLHVPGPVEDYSDAVTH